MTGRCLWPQEQRTLSLTQSKNLKLNRSQSVTVRQHTQTNDRSWQLISSTNLGLSLLWTLTLWDRDIGACNGRCLLLGFSAEEWVRGRCGCTVNVLFFIALKKHHHQLHYTQDALCRLRRNLTVNIQLLYLTQPMYLQTADVELYITIYTDSRTALQLSTVLDATRT